MRILLATDGSRSAERARDLVAAMPWPAGTTIRIVSVVPRGANIAASWTPETAHEPEEDRYRDPGVRAHAVALADAERDLSLAHPDARIERFLFRGRPASLILQEARDFAADLIVVGQPRPRDDRDDGPRLGLGGGRGSRSRARCSWRDPRRPARSSSPTTGRRAQGSRRPSSKACPCRPTPRSRSSRSPTPVSRTRPRPRPALYNEAMAQYRESRDEAGREARAVASAAVARFEQLGHRATPCRARRRSGPRNRGVHEGEPDGLLVLGTRGNTGLKRLLLGSVARNVLLHAPCSVLIVRETVVPPTNGEALIEQMAGSGRGPPKVGRPCDGHGGMG